MTRTKTSDAETMEVKAFSLQDIERGVAKLRRRIAEVNALNPRNVRREDAIVKSAERNIQADILEIFGLKSPEYKEHRNLVIWHREQGLEVMGLGSYYDPQEAFAAGIPQTVTILEGLIARLEEKRSELSESPTTRAAASIDALDLHQRIADVSLDLYKDSHYANAVFDACKALINFVKERSGKYDLDGASLVQTVFSPKNPILAFNELKDQSDLDEQQGMMHLFAGVVLAVRNPRGHDFPIDSAERAFEYLALLNLLAHRLQKARRIKGNSE